MTAPANDWRQLLPRLAPLNLPLLPIGPGGDGKAPADPRTGGNLAGWTTAAFTPEQVAAACSSIRAVGTRTGPDADGLAVFDIDGATAVAHCKGQGCDPAAAETWRIHRDTAGDRLKVCWRIPAELWGHLGQTVSKHQTKAPSSRGAGDGENAALYHGVGQVVLLGEHISSGGNYFWPEGRGPEALAEITPEWWELALQIAENDPDQQQARPAGGGPKGSRSTAGGGDWFRPRRCVICGRDKHRVCRQKRNGEAVRCYHGSSFHPPEVRRGGVIDGLDGQRWAFTRTDNCWDGGVFSNFVLHNPDGRRDASPAADPMAGFEDQSGGGDPAEQGQQEGQPEGAAQGPQRPPQRAAMLTAEQVAERLRGAHRDGVGGTDLEVLLAELAAASDLHPLRLNAISATAAAEVDSEHELEREALALEAEADRQAVAATLTLAELLPAPIAEQLGVRVADMPYDDLVAAVAWLGMVAGLTKLGTKVCGNAATRFEVPTNLFVAIVASTGRKKTPLTNAAVLEPIEPVRRGVARENGRALSAWEDDCRASKRGEKPPRPPLVHALVNDYSGEGFAELLQTHDTRGLGVLVLRDELAGLFGSMNAYRSGRGGDEQQLLELFDGGAFASVRVSHARIYSRSQVSILGNVQPKVLASLVDGQDPSGKWARFLFCPLPERIVALPTEVSPEQEHATAQAIGYLRSVAEAVYCLPAETYHLEPGGVALFAGFELAQQQLNHSADLEPVRALAGKSAGKVLRVAGLLHILRRVCDPGMGEPHTIRTADLQKAVRLVETLDQWAAGFHADAVAAADAMGGASNLATRIHNCSAGCGGRWIGWRDFARTLSRKQRGGVTRRGFQQAVERLAGQPTTAGNSRHVGCFWGETRRGGGGGTEYRAIKPPI